MTKRSPDKFIARVLLVFALAFCLTASACAERAECAAFKGSVAAAGTRIDRASYTDGSLYENEPASSALLRVGIDYGDTAVYGAELYCASGGFELGFMRGDSFSPAAVFDCYGLSVYPVSEYGEIYHALYSGSYSSCEEAREHCSDPGCFPAYINGSFRVLRWSLSSRDYTESVILREGSDATVYTSHGFTVYGDTSLLVDSTEPLCVRPAAEGAELYYNGNSYRGIMRLSQNSDGLIDVVNLIDLENYVKGVIPYEMSDSWPFEALKAQAVCARTYAEFNRGSYEEQGFDLTDDVYSQVYRGTAEATDFTDSAVDATAGQYVRYRGEICDVYYFSTDGGATESGENVFGRPRPYLSGIIDPFDISFDHYMNSWERYLDGWSAAWLLTQRGYEAGCVYSVEPQYSPTDNVIAILCRADTGDILLSGRDAYTALGLDSCRFTVSGGDGEFYFSGSGWGHNCGMSQWGAYAMAEHFGYDYRDILRFYFTGTYIA